MNTRNAILASAVASLFLAAGARAEGTTKAASDGKVKCAGINSCSGKGSCASASNSCSGKNGCGGKGWNHTASEKECTDKGGKVMAANDAKPAPKK
jgi:hypothetical protein